jgi:NAD(P)-dependent dehydrogenase (short-subunit alcohol dehydrogenase family)
MAELFAAQGARVVCADVSGKQEQVAFAIGGAAAAVHADVAEESDVQAMIAAAENKFGKLDILVNNAGFGGGLMPLHEQTTENWERVHAVNLKGVFWGMKYGIISMLKTGGGAIVNISSAAGVVGWKGHGVYGAAKAGVNQLTKSAALDYARQNIRVNAICPGTTWTGLVPLSAQHEKPPADVFLVPGTPMQRWGLASEIAYAALFLASDEASFITGVTLPVDGGYSIGFSGMAAEQG